jgi:hypothetical protein
MAGTIVCDTIQDGAGNSTATDNAIYGSAKAWAYFNGTTATIYSSYNVSSITRVSAGLYYANFTNALVDTNYCALASQGNNLASCSNSTSSRVTVNSFYVTSLAGGTTAQDSSALAVVVFR